MENKWKNNHFVKLHVNWYIRFCCRCLKRGLNYNCRAIRNDQRGISEVLRRLRKDLGARDKGVHNIKGIYARTQLRI